jgi:hypothetical protein
MPREPYDYTNTCNPNADVLAADAWVQEYGVSEDGVILLMDGFWGKVRTDLDHGLPGTRLWLDSDAFDFWASAGGVDPDVLRDHLIAAHWQQRAA